LRVTGYTFGIAVALLLATSGAPVAVAATNAAPVTVSVHGYFMPDDPTDAMTSQLIDLMRKDTSLRIEQWGGIALPGGWGRSSLMMAFAGNTAPDIMRTFFHGIRSDQAQGFLYPLNEWIGDDRDGNGQVDPSEAKWAGWTNIPPLWRMVATVDGKIYGLPIPEITYTGIIYRKDLAAAAGLDPEKPPPGTSFSTGASG